MKLFRLAFRAAFFVWLNAVSPCGDIWAQQLSEKTEDTKPKAEEKIEPVPAESQSKPSEEAPLKLEDFDEIVVTATRTARSVKDVPASVTTITRDQMEGRKIIYLDEATKFAVGVLDRRRKPQETLPIVSMRGLPGQSRNLVMLDGLPIHTAYTADVPWSGIPPEYVERIEIVRGPQSALYGGDAMGGAINIITRMPQKQEFNLKGGYGTFDTLTGHISYGNRLFEKLSFFVGYDAKHTDGYRAGRVTAAPTSSGSGTDVIPTLGFKRTEDTTGTQLRYVVGHTGPNWWTEDALTTKISLDITPRWNVTFGGIFTGYDYGYDRGRSYFLNALTGARVESGYVRFTDQGVLRRLSLSPGSFQGGFGAQENNIYTVTSKYTTKGGAEYKIGLGIVDMPDSWWTTPSSSATWTGGPGTMGETTSTDIVLDMQSNIPLGNRVTLTLGAGLRAAEAHSEDYDLTDWRRKTKNPVTRINEGKSITYDGYGQVEYKPWDILRLYAGARYDIWHSYDGHSFVRNYQDKDYPSRTVGAFTPKGGLSLDVLKGTTVRASVARAFRPPTVYELYRTWRSSTGKVTTGNPYLNPETETAWEIGVDQTLWKGTIVSVTYFDSCLEDLIYTRTVSSTLQDRANAERGHARGVEFEARSAVTSWLDVFANYSFADSRIDKNTPNPAAQGKRLAMTPKEMMNFGVEFKKAPFRLTFLGHYQDKMYATDANTDVKSGVYGSYDGFFTLDAKATWDITKNLRASLAMDNVFNERYYQYWVAPGRTLLATLELKF